MFIVTKISFFLVLHLLWKIDSYFYTYVWWPIFYYTPKYLVYPVRQREGFKNIYFKNYLYITLKVYIPIRYAVVMSYIHINLHIIVQNFLSNIYQILQIMLVYNSLSFCIKFHHLIFLWSITWIYDEYYAVIFRIMR